MGEDRKISDVTDTPERKEVLKIDGLRRCTAMVWNPDTKSRDEAEGFFHCWGKNFEEFDDGACEVTVAVIELDDGRVITTAPDFVKFKRGEKSE